MLIKGTQGRFWRLGLRVAVVSAVMAGGGLAHLGGWQLGSQAFAQDDATPAAAPAPVVKKAPAKKAPVKKKAEKPAEPAAEPAAAAAPAPAAPAAGQAAAQPATPFDDSVKKASLRACAKTFVDLGKTAAANSDYMAMSQWNQTQPDSHAVQSLVGMNFKNQAGLSSGAGVVFASPIQGGCEGNMVRIVPAQQTCGVVAQSMGITNNQQIPSLSGVPVLTAKNGTRIMLVPAGNTCVIVTVAAAGNPQATAQH
jgi:hypothetical protein